MLRASTRYDVVYSCPCSSHLNRVVLHVPGVPVVPASRSFVNSFVTSDVVSLLILLMNNANRFSVDLLPCKHYYVADRA